MNDQTGVHYLLKFRFGLDVRVLQNNHPERRSGYRLDSRSEAGRLVRKEVGHFLTREKKEGPSRFQGFVPTKPHSMVSAPKPRKGSAPIIKTKIFQPKF